MVAAESGSTEFLVWSTYLYEADLVAEHLERAGIPFYRYIETMGVRFQMAAAVPAGSLPGSRFLVVVPEPEAARARALVASLPVSRHEEA
jgi:hypothetical protein